MREENDAQKKKYAGNKNENGEKEKEIRKRISVLSVIMIYVSKFPSFFGRFHFLHIFELVKTPSARNFHFPSFFPFSNRATRKIYLCRLYYSPHS